MSRATFILLFALPFSLFFLSRSLIFSRFLSSMLAFMAAPPSQTLTHPRYAIICGGDKMLAIAFHRASTVSATPSSAPCKRWHKQPIVVGQVNGHEGKKREPCEVDRQKYLQMRAISWIEKKYILKCKSSEATKGRGLLFCHFINLSAARHHVYLQGPQMLGQQRADPPLGDGRLVGPEPRGHVPDPVFLLRG